MKQYIMGILHGLLWYTIGIALNIPVYFKTMTVKLGLYYCTC